MGLIWRRRVPGRRWHRRQPQQVGSVPVPPCRPAAAGQLTRRRVVPAVPWSVVAVRAPL